MSRHDKFFATTCVVCRAGCNWHDADRWRDTVQVRCGPEMPRTFMGCHMRKAPPKQALKVASGSVTPCSVPATCARTGCMLEKRQHIHRSTECREMHKQHS